MRKVMLLWLMLGIGVCVSAQTITGTVTSAKDGDTLPGVSVAVKGTTNGTITDVDGKFSITVNSAKAVLEFTYVGYQTKEVPVNGSSKALQVALNENTQLLNEVVVTAYGTVKRANLTTAQVSVTSQQLNKTVNTTIEQAIQGRAAGVYVTQNSGQPGGAMSVNIRGVSSITGNTEPLYVIDGVQIQGNSVSSDGGGNPIAGLNPSDVDDIQILQGPSAAALYGSRATNGVILITTKRGKAGDTRINYSYELTSQRTPDHLPMMNLQEYATFMDQYAGPPPAVPGQFADPSLLGKGTDWQSVLFRNVPMYKHSADISGGTEKLKYFLSGEYMDQGGIAVGSGFSRYGVRLNVDNKASNWLTIGLNVNYNQIDESVGTLGSLDNNDIINNALRMTPQIPVSNLDGTWGGSDNVNGAGQYAPVNPIAIANLNTNTNVQRKLIAGGNFRIDILPGLFFKGEGNTNLGFRNDTQYQPKYNIDQWHQNTLNSLTSTANLNTWWMFNELLQYSKTFGKHYVEAMVSHEASLWTYKNLSGSGSDFPVDYILDLNAANPNPLNRGNSGGQGSGSMESYLGRINYNFAERYLLTASVRRDGSSNFGVNNKWGTFPSASIGWRIANEPWWNFPVMNEAKLRFELGTTGNQGGGGIYATMDSRPTPWGTGFTLSQYANPDLKWESTMAYNGGVDLGFLKNRIQASFDVFVRKTDNLLMTAPFPDYMGTTGYNGAIAPPQINFGSLKNTGWMLSITSTNIDTKNFKWTSNFNISAARPVITKLNTNSSQAMRVSPFDGSVREIAQVGQAPWLFYGYIEEGYFKSVDEINGSAVPADNNGDRYPADPEGSKGVWVGDVKYKDINGRDANGNLTGKPDGIINSDDQTVIGNPWPKSSGGLTNTFSYKDFDLSVLFIYSYGNQILNWQKNQVSRPQNYWTSKNVIRDVVNYAQVGTDADGNPYLVNPGAYIPRLGYDTDVNGNWTRVTTRWVEDGSYLRLKNVSLTYTIPKSIIDKQRIIRGVRLSVSAQNLWTLTKYTGYDPEVGSYVGRGTGATNQVIGVDYNHYPLTRMYTFSVNVNL